MPTGASTHDQVLELLAEGLLSGADSVLARVWLMGPGDSCDGCAMRDECADRTRCLHLTRSAGTSERLDGPFRRFPLGAREVGRVPSTLHPFVVNDGLEALALADRAWLMAHDVRAFAAAPIVVDGACAGVVAVFARSAIDRTRLQAIEAMAAIAGRALRAASAAHRSGAAVTRGGRAGPAPAAAASRPDPVAPAPAAPQRPPHGGRAHALEILRAWDDTEREILERVLEHTGGRVSGPRGAAAILALKPTTLQSRLKRLGVRRRRA